MCSSAKRKIKLKVRRGLPSELRNYRTHWKLPLASNYNLLKSHFTFILKGKINNEEVTKEFYIASYPYLPFMPGRYVDLQDGKDIYRLVFTEKYDITKFVMLVKIYHNLITK